MSGCPRLRLIFRRDRKLLLDPPDFLGCMSPEEALHVRRKFAQKVGYRIRAQRTAEAIHGVSESSVMSWVIAVFQRTGEQSAQELGRVECAIAVVVPGDHHSGRGIARAGNKRSLVRRKIARILMQDRREGKSLDESPRFCICQSRAKSLRPTLRTSAVVGPLSHCVGPSGLKTC